MATVLHGYRGAGLYTALLCMPVFVGLGVGVMDVVVGVAVAAAMAVSAVTAVVPVVVSLSSMVVSMVMWLMSELAGGASVVGVPEDGGGSYDNPGAVGVEGGASHMRLGGSLDGVVVGVLVGWVAWGSAPGGGGGVKMCPGALFGVLAVGVVEGGSTLISACGGGGRLG